MSKSPSLRRIQADIRELLIDPSTRYHAAPLENGELLSTIRSFVEPNFKVLFCFFTELFDTNDNTT